ncbi:hypothetical protein ALC62_11067 [Cyphomyrmex costatus]|uniref:Uncharacterized protein n=1 Tax=Cyphomyrmex costatus TaxID=456900 RepID=A0A151ICW2_9HYME|nr:hypothetical protein ALC62_11067 [Cyphomyrmex costatus]
MTYVPRVFSGHLLKNCCGDKPCAIDERSDTGRYSTARERELRFAESMLLPFVFTVKTHVNDREKSDSLPSSRLYAISSLSFSGYSFWAQTIPRSNTESESNIVRCQWTVRE